jgi:PTS system mannose-specific IID component
MPKLEKKDLVKNWLLGYSSETCYNYERLQGLGNTNAFMPIIRALYPEEKQAEELKKYLIFFNTEPSWMGTVVHGITAAMEEQRANGENVTADDIISVRSALMGPLAGIGDVVSQSICYPILAGVCISLALSGNFAGPILFEVVYKFLMLVLGYNMYMLGYNKGKEAILDLLSTGILNKILDAVSIVGLMVIGAIACGNVNFDLSFLEWEFPNALGSVKFNVQHDVFDTLLPGILELAAVLGVWGLLRKKAKPTTIILIIFAVAFCLVGLKALTGAY